MKHISLLVLALIVLSIGTGNAIDYKMIDLGVVGTSSSAYSINSSGWVVGLVNGEGVKGFLWTPEQGIATYLVTGSTHTGATSINDFDQIAGAYGFQSHAILFPFTPLGELPGGNSSWANSINNSGKIAGWSNDAAGQMHAVFWGPDIIDLGPGSASAINDSDTIAGSSSGHAATWSSSGSITYLPEPYGLFFSSAQAINAGGTAVGFGEDNANIEYPLLWRTDGSVIDLPLLPGDTSGCAWGINASGLITGRSGDSAVIWNSDGSITTLPGSGEARAINDSGWVAGVSNGRAVVWTPIPEPSTLVMVAMGAVGIVRLHRKRHNG